jgi:hypothetical protein
MIKGFNFLLGLPNNKVNLCLRGDMGWWFGSLGIDGFVNLDKIKKQTTPVNNEIVENKENKFKTTTIATRLGLLLN